MLSYYLRSDCFSCVQATIKSRPGGNERHASRHTPWTGGGPKASLGHESEHAMIDLRLQPRDDRPRLIWEVGGRQKSIPYGVLWKHFKVPFTTSGESQGQISSC